MSTVLSYTADQPGSVTVLVSMKILSNAFVPASDEKKEIKSCLSFLHNGSRTPFIFNKTCKNQL